MPYSHQQDMLVKLGFTKWKHITEKNVKVALTIGVNFKVLYIIIKFYFI